MTFQRMRRGPWMALCVGALLVVAGCGDGSSAAPSPSGPVETTTPEPSQEPEPVATDRAGKPLVPPQRPAAMDNDDEAGAQAAAEYFIELYGYAIQSQDLAAFSEFCDPVSAFCNGVITAVNADRVNGVRTEGGNAELEATRVDPPGEHPFYAVWGRVDREPFIAMDSSDTPLHESPGEDDVDFVAFTEWLPAGGWIVRGAETGVVPPS